MPVKQPLTIEILGSINGTPAVLDRVIGGSVFLEEAKQIAQRLLARIEAETAPTGYRILSQEHNLVYGWEIGRDEQSNQNKIA